MALTAAEKMRRRREKLVAAHLCSRCGARKRWKALSVCRPCNEEAKERVRASRS